MTLSMFLRIPLYIINVSETKDKYTTQVEADTARDRDHLSAISTEHENTDRRENRKLLLVLLLCFLNSYNTRHNIHIGTKNNTTVTNSFIDL